MNETTITAEQLANYIKRHGSRTLGILGHFQPFVDAMHTEIGKELLRDAVSIHESLLSKVAELTATPEETMEYKAIRKILMMWAERITRYEKALAELSK